MSNIQLLAEARYIKRLMTEVTPTGILSLVCDSFDFWGVVTKILPSLKDKIMAREGTVVIRPDSGDPVDILCGMVKYPYFYDSIDEAYAKLDGNFSVDGKVVNIAGNWRSAALNLDGRVGFGAPIPEHEVKGLIECLYDTFGGTATESGLIALDSHIGAIYGDSITLARQDQIIKRLKAKGFVPSVVLGIGSFTYQYVTRDTHGTAVKATDTQHGTGNHVAISKDPKTDSSKKSAKGLLMVVKDESGRFQLKADVTPEEEASEANELNVVYKDGQVYNLTTLNEIRERVDSYFL